MKKDKFTNSGPVFSGPVYLLNHRPESRVIQRMGFLRTIPTFAISVQLDQEDLMWLKVASGKSAASWGPGEGVLILEVWDVGALDPLWMWGRSGLKNGGA